MATSSLTCFWMGFFFHIVINKDSFQGVLCYTLYMAFQKIWAVLTNHFSRWSKIGWIHKWWCWSGWSSIFVDLNTITCKRCKLPSRKIQITYCIWMEMGLCVESVNCQVECFSANIWIVIVDCVNQNWKCPVLVKSSFVTIGQDPHQSITESQETQTFLA